MTRHSTTYAREAEAERTLKSRGVMYNNKNTHLEFTAFSQKALPLTFSGIDSTNWMPLKAFDDGEIELISRQSGSFIFKRDV